MDINYKCWLKDKHDTCLKNRIESCGKLERDEITFNQHIESVNKYDQPLMDLYKQLSKIERFPWDKDYQTMMTEIIRESRTYMGIEDVNSFLQIFRCSLILYDQYHLKYDKKYSLNQLQSGIWGGFGGREDYVFNNVRQTIKDDLSINIIKDNKYLDSLQLKYSNKYDYEI
jgi:hypothetical protein